MAKEPFPSPRQASCAGLKRQFYPAHIRHFVDYDYEARLSLSDRQWLAAFTEELYRGWRLKRETQLSVDLAREGGRKAAMARHHKQAELHQHTDPLEVEPVVDDSDMVIEQIDNSQQRARTAALSSCWKAPAPLARRAGRGGDKARPGHRPPPSARRRR